MARPPLTLLLLSAGRRAALLDCFRAAAAEAGVALRALAADLDPGMSAACRRADAAFALPRCDAPDYADAVLRLVRREGVGLVVPTIDPELAPLAERAGCFAEAGARLHASDAATVADVRDKERTMRRLRAADVPTPWTAPLEAVRAAPEAAPWPLFLKPAGGSAGRGLGRAGRPGDLPRETTEPMIAQALLEGPEYTVNLFVDRDGRLRCAVPHRRVRVRAGEVEKGVTERRDDLAAIAARLVDALPGLRGALCFQAIDDARSGPAVIEVNARFGGGYPLADRAGATFARWLLEEAAGLPCTAHDRWRGGVTMLRYDAAVFLEPGS
jgi:carbamoyl-phosphate synthase large subunit